MMILLDQTDPVIVKASPGLSTTGTVKDHPAGDTLSNFAIPDGQNLDDLKNIKIDGSYPTITNVTSTKSDATVNMASVSGNAITFTLANGTLDLVRVMAITPILKYLLQHLVVLLGTHIRDAGRYYQ